MNKNKIGMILAIFIYGFAVLFAINQMYLYPVGVVSTTGSMTPTATGYDITISDNTVDYSDIKKGDIINFERNCGDVKPFDDSLMNNLYDKAPAKNENIMHRIVGNTSNGYMTKGDNNSYVDQTVDCIDYIDKESYNGKIIHIISFGQEEFTVLRNSIFTFFITSILMLVFEMVFRNGKKKK